LLPIQETALSWEARGSNNRQYFYEVRREGSTLKKYYWGDGPAAIERHREILRQRQLVADQRSELREMQADMWAIDQRIRLLNAGCLQFLYATYLMAGYQPTASRNWKKNRKMNPTRQTQKTESNTGDPPESASPTQPQTFDEAIEAAKRGEPGALETVSKYVDHHPDLISTYGDMATYTRTAWCKKLAAGNPVVYCCLAKQATQRVDDLVGETPTAQETLLAQRVVIHEMQLSFYEQFEAASVEKLIGTPTGTWVTKRQESASHQMQRAISQLTTLQKLQGEIRRTGPAASLRLFDPNRKAKQKTA